MTRCIAGFIQQLAVSYVGRGYWFYVTGRVPDGKDPSRVDAKLVGRYGIDISKWARARRKKLGLANMQYIRHGRFFVLLATHGRHAFFEGETKNIRDVRRVPIKHAGYAVSFRDGHPHVRIERREYLELKATLIDAAARRGTAGVGGMLRTLNFEPYAPIRRQLLCLLRAANRELKERGCQPVGRDCLRFKRTVAPIFGQSPSVIKSTEVAIQGDTGRSSAGSSPGDEFGEIDPPLAALAVVDPGLGPIDQLGESPLSQAGV